MPACDPDPFGLPMRAEAAAFRRARSGAFHPAKSDHAMISVFCQENVAISFATKDAGGAYRVGYSGQHPIACFNPSDRAGLLECEDDAVENRGPLIPAIRRWLGSRLIRRCRPNC
jgi:hypothetical protein